jgi:endogenous inhibitor of DNA gyrase (YacG/DUF329 family)
MMVDEQDLEDTCAICGKHLSSHNRSSVQPDLCKSCSGEEESEQIDDFK